MLIYIYSIFVCQRSKTGSIAAMHTRRRLIDRILMDPLIMGIEIKAFQQSVCGCTNTIGMLLIKSWFVVHVKSLGFGRWYLTLLMPRQFVIDIGEELLSVDMGHIVKYNVWIVSSNQLRHFHLEQTKCTGSGHIFAICTSSTSFIQLS